MNVVRADIGLELRLHAVGLGDFFRDEPLPLQHVEEIGVTAEVQLIGPLQLDAAILEQPGQDTMHDGRADLRLDVVADDGDAALLEASPPVWLPG